MSIKWLDKTEVPQKTNVKYSEPAYPMLLTEQQELTMTPDELVSEVDSIVYMSSRKKAAEGMYIYSLQTIEPMNVGRLVDENKLDGLASTCVNSALDGYFYNSCIYESTSEDLGRALAAMAAASRVIEVSLRRDADSHLERKKVVVNSSMPTSNH